MRPSSIIFTAAVLTCSFLIAAPAVEAQSLQIASSSKSTDSALWEIHLNLQKAIASPLGKWVTEIVEKEEPEAMQNVVKFAEAIGIDPRTDIGEVVVFGDGFDETDAILVANIGPSTGNLEGWILAAPGYKSEDLDDNTLLHSMTAEKKNMRAWLALPKHTPSGNYVLVGSLDRNRTVELSRQVLAGNLRPVPNPLEGDALLKFFVNDLSAVPMDIDDDDPGSAVVKTVKQFGLDVASDADSLWLNLEITASSAGKARQISQLLIGLKAMLQLIPLEEAEVEQLAKVLDSMEVNHTEGQSKVQAGLSAPYSVLEALAQEID